MTNKNLVRRYVYEETEEEITKWAETMIREKRMMKPPNRRPNFPFYLEQFINHLKFKARKEEPNRLAPFKPREQACSIKRTKGDTRGNSNS